MFPFPLCPSGCLTCGSLWLRPGPAWLPESLFSWRPSPTRSCRTRARRCSRPTSSMLSSSSGYSEGPGGVAEQLQPCETCCPFWGRRNHGLMYGLLISDFCFSKVKHNILLPRSPLSPSLLCALWLAVTGRKHKNLPEWHRVHLRAVGKPADAGKWRLWRGCVYLTAEKHSSSPAFWRNSLVAVMLTKPGSIFH